MGRITTADSLWCRVQAICEYWGAYHLAKKSGNFGLESNGKAIFRKIFSEIVDNLQRLRNALTICENSSVSRPFLTISSKICGMECCVVNVSTILIRLVIKFGKSLTFMQRSFHPDYLAKW